MNHAILFTAVFSVSTAGLCIKLAAQEDAGVEVYDPPLEIQTNSEASLNCPKELQHKARRPASARSDQPEIQYHCAPEYPEACMGQAKNVEIVSILYDVGTDGVPVNARVTRSTNACHIEAAAISVLRWRFRPSKTGFVNLSANIQFQIEN